MQYYIAPNGQQEGPFDESELLAHGVNASTLVWCEGMAQWQQAGQVPELAYLFQQQQGYQQPAGNTYQQQYAQQQPYQQPYAQQQPYGQQMPPQPNSNLVWAILCTLFCCLPLGIVSIVYAANSSSAYNAGRYEESVKNAKLAGKWAMWGAISSIILAILYCILAVGLGLFCIN